MDAQQKDIFLRELERKSLDTIMVYNPTEKDYLIEWDKRYHVVPSKNKDIGFGKGRAEHPRYLAEKYAREMKNKLINDEAAGYVQKLVEEHQKKGQPFRDKYEENAAALPYVPKTDNEELINKIYDMVVLGMVREFGKDSELPPEGTTMDTRSPEERVLENMNKKYVETPVVVDDPTTPEVKHYPINKKVTGNKDVLADVKA